MDKNTVYSEMCEFLSEKEQLLKDFQQFYNRYKDSENFEKLFEDGYGAMYESFKSAKEEPQKQTQKDKVPTTEKQEPAFNDTAIIREYIQFLWREGIHNDIRTIRKWIQFFGWFTIISMTIYIIILLIGLANTPS